MQEKPGIHFCFNLSLTSLASIIEIKQLFHKPPLVKIAAEYNIKHTQI